jgi:prepilin-type N-terminal cleavage/methylation domain-containing protein
MQRVRLSASDGFTLIEVMVAMVVLVIGLAGTLKLIDQANATTTSTKAREQAVALQREVVEAARGIGYAELTPTAVVGLIRQQQGFQNCASVASGTPCSTITSEGWTVQRRGIVYHLTVGVCSVDSPNDDVGPHVGGTFCATGGGAANATTCERYLGANGSVRGTGAATGTTVGDCGIDLNFDGKVDNLTESETGVTSPSGTADQNPDDYKRIVTLVRWDRGTGLRYALQSTTLPYPGLSGAPRVADIAPLNVSDPITSPSTTAATFLVGTNRKAASVAWLLSGTPAGTASDQGGGVSWQFSWNLGAVGGATATAPSPGEVLDGPYNVGARAFDLYGAGGPAKWYTIRVNRRAPYPPTAFQAVRSNDIVWTRWAKSPESDIEGYEVYRKPLLGTPQLVCALSKDTVCADRSLPSTGTYDYYVQAYDRDPAGALRAGQASASVSVPLMNRVPDRPINVTATRSGGQVTVTWQDPPNGDPDGLVVAYRVYRDGTAIDDRYFESANATVHSMVDGAAGDGPHDYYVVAVDNLGAESQPEGPKTA